MTNVGIVTQARVTSSRLPGKVLLKAEGKTMLEHHLHRLSDAGQPVIVATTVNDTDDPIVRLCEAVGVGVYRGSENDVLSRYVGAAEAFGLDTIVRVTSDCPLIDGTVVATGISTYLAASDPWVFVSNTVERTFPRGMDFEIFSTMALLEANVQATELYQREHVTPYLYEWHDRRERSLSILHEPDYSAYRLTLDTDEDLLLLRTLIENFGAERLSTDGIVAVLSENPNLIAINQAVRQKPTKDSCVAPDSSTLN